MRAAMPNSVRPEMLLGSALCWWSKRSVDSIRLSLGYPPGDSHSKKKNQQSHSAPSGTTPKLNERRCQPDQCHPSQPRPQAHWPFSSRFLRPRRGFGLRGSLSGFLLQLTLLVRKLLLLDLSSLLLFIGEMDPDWDRGHRHCSICQQSGGNLVTSAPHSVGSLHHGRAHQPSHSNRHIADYPALQQDRDQRVTNQPRDRRANAVRKSAYIRRMLARVNLAAQSFGAPWTRHSCIHPVVSSTQRL